MIFLLAIALTRPLRQSWAKDFTNHGDSYLAEKKYVSATVEYKKAQTLDSDNKEIADRLALAGEAQNNVLKLEEFYRQSNNIAQLDLFNKARSVPESSYDLVALSKTLLESNEPQLAAEAAKTATEMDKEYRDAWLYLGISNLNTARQVELKSEAANNYLVQAKESFKQAKSLDPSHAATNDFLKQL